MTPKRLFIVGLVAALALSYFGSIRGYLDQRADLARQQSALSDLIGERDTIRTRMGSLDDPAVIEARARELGYVKPGELPLRVTNLEAGPPPEPARRDDGGIWEFLPDLR